MVVFVLHTPGLGEGFLMGEEKSWTYYGDITENANEYEEVRLIMTKN